MSPLTITTKYREKMKEDVEKWQEYKKKEAKRNQEYRKRLSQKMKSDSNLLEKKKEKDRVRQQVLRQKKSVNNIGSLNCDIYSCKQTMGKAIKKVERALPRNLNRKIAILKSLCNKYLRPTETMDENTTKSSKSLMREKLIEKFFLQDGISVQAPGRKDTMLINGKVVSKRFMLMTLAEAYQLFKSEYTEEKLTSEEPTDDNIVQNINDKEQLENDGEEEVEEEPQKRH
ncbi:uncharacterized protein LOC128862597 [Anastrepha ludens]|uniref:uncharacterized protein LOC128862597 n=1 Tax=Anastrepha ludens TaxID=28586 RepID=UPI0023B024DF|nr:uncharacterized protein LOC128862597 [Anastrepha ludens]